MTTAPATAPSQITHTDLARLYTEIANNRLPLPNFEEMDLAQGVAHIAADTLLECSPVCWLSIPEIDGGRGNYARLFAEIRNGRFTGCGFVMVFSASGIGRIGRFAICRHVSKLDPGANPSRGWRPAHCEKCGLDMTVDSGD